MLRNAYNPQGLHAVAAVASKTCDERILGRTHLVISHVGGSAAKEQAIREQETYGETWIPCMSFRLIFIGHRMHVMLGHRRT